MRRGTDFQFVSGTDFQSVSNSPSGILEPGYCQTLTRTSYGYLRSVEDHTRGIVYLCSEPETCQSVSEARGFRTEFQGVAMHHPNEEGYSRPGVYVIDDWR